MILGGVGAWVNADPRVFAPIGTANTTTRFEIEAEPPAGDSLAAWQLQILDNGQVVTEWLDAGPPPPAIDWDGRDANGDLPPGNATYDYQLTVTSTLGLNAVTPLKPVTVDLAKPGVPLITNPATDVTQPRAVRSVSGTAEPLSVVVVWLQTESGQVLRAGETAVDSNGDWTVPQVVLDSGDNLIWVTATDAADQESDPSDAVTITVAVLPPLKWVERAPFPAGLDQTLVFTAGARGTNDPVYPDYPTVGVTATLNTLTGQEWLTLSTSNPDDATSIWTDERTVDTNLGNAKYDVPVEGCDAEGTCNTSYVGLWTDVTSPATPRFIQPEMNEQVHLVTYTVKGQADPGSFITLLVGSTEYTTTAGQNQGYWEVTVDLVEGNNSLQANAKDQAGNESLWSDSLVLSLDLTPPQIEAAVNPLWQQPSQPVEITANVIESGPLYLGDVWAEVEGPDPAKRHLQPGNPWQETFTAGQPGYYTATVRVRDRAGNVASDEVPFIYDGTPPVVSLSLAATQPYGHTEASTVYYGEGSGDFTVTATMTDKLAGLEEVAFPTTTDGGGSYSLGGVAGATQAHPYDFTQSDSFSDTVEVEVTDRAGNVGTQAFVVVNDTIPPTATITAPSVAGLRFGVSWGGSDPSSSSGQGAGVRGYEVEFQEDGGAWTTWLTDTPLTTAYFRGEIGKTYRFQVRATDRVNNTGAWVESGLVEIATVTKYYTFGGQRIAMRQGDEVYYLHGDHLGSTSLTTDDAGQVVAETRYLPYGRERWSAGALPTDFTFTGQRAERGFGLLDYNARYYSPTLGRFISPDSIVPEPTSSSGFNRYRYARNNPLKHVDPSGHQDCEFDCEEEDDDDDELQPLDDDSEPPSDERKDLLEDWHWQGLRGEASAIAGIGVDVNVDIMWINFDPKQSSIIIEFDWQKGLNLGASANGGPIFTRNVETLAEYKHLHEHAGATLSDDVFLNFFGFEGEFSWKDDYEPWDAALNGQGPQSVFIGAVGTLEELGFWHGETAAKLDFFELIGVKEVEQDELQEKH